MSKVTQYLQEHLTGEVMDSSDAREYFSTDASIFTLLPTTVVYPRSEGDVRKTARFTWQLAERGRIIPITARGSGTDQTGAALGSGVIMAFPAHMNRIIEIDSKSGQVVVEPGINYGKLQQTLITHGLFLPAAPSTLEYSTVGGAVAKNSSGDKSFKYGDTRTFVQSLRVVLANGEVIDTQPLGKRELNKKLGLATFEGEIYRAMDALLEENRETIEGMRRGVTKNTAGYDLLDIKTKNGFDLSPLFVGSEGTLGIITEITLDTLPHTPTTTLLVGMFDDVNLAAQAVSALRRLSDLPSSIEMLDEGLLDLVNEINPSQLKEIIVKPFPKVIIIVEFDDANERTQKHAAKKAEKIFEKHAISQRLATEEEEQRQLQKLRHSVATVLAHNKGKKHALPFIEDGIVPPEKLAEYLDGTYQMLERNHIKSAIWGHAGDANLHIMPYLDLNQVGDRQLLFRLLDEYSELINDLGGSTSGGHGDGRLRTPYLHKLYGETAYGLFQKLKQIFDPYGTLNPGVKVNATLDDLKPLLRRDYSLGSWYDHMPRG
ncbi:MAG TPA: FAD-binding oxidoreductase [Candidatus Saccharimonadales bacterium]|nr:FAD-binding oxidoreductase [Candidatus Saccharimonadales bacterium]